VRRAQASQPHVVSAKKTATNTALVNRIFLAIFATHVSRLSFKIKQQVHWRYKPVQSAKTVQSSLQLNVHQQTPNHSCPNGSVKNYLTQRVQYC
jgi:hypothetical protein